MKFQDDISMPHTRTQTHTRTSRNQYVPHFFEVGGIKRLYNLHMNPIATRRNVKSDVRIQPRNVIVGAQKTVSTEHKKMLH